MYDREAAVHPHGGDSGRCGHASRGGPAVQEHPDPGGDGALLLRQQLVPVLQPRHLRRTCEGQISFQSVCLHALCSHATLACPGVLIDADIYTLTEQFIRETPTPTGAINTNHADEHTSHTADSLLHYTDSE